MALEPGAVRPETDLRMELVGGGTICLRGADNYDSLRGEGLDFLVLDEYASIAPEAWTEVLRPALADRQGRALFIGTPQGHNHFHELVERAAKLPDWTAFQYTTAQGGNVPPAELESAAKQLDERVFRQEFEASFLSMGSDGLITRLTASTMLRVLNTVLTSSCALSNCSTMDGGQTRAIERCLAIRSVG